MTTPVNFRVKNGLTVANGATVSAGNLEVTTGVLIVNGVVINSTSIVVAANNAYANAIAYADNRAANAYSNAVSYANTRALNTAATAYSNAINYADGKAADAYSNAVTYIDNKSGNAYSNAVTFASNASNLTTGTLPINRLPATVNVALALNVTNTVNIVSGNISITDANNSAFFTGTRIAFTDTATEIGNSFYVTVTHDQLITSKAYVVAGNTYSDYGTFTRRGFFAVDGLDTANNDIFLRSISANTTVFSIGNTTIRTTINSTSISGNGALITSVNAAAVGGNTASDLRGYTETFASNATNLSSGTVNSARLPAGNATSAGAVVLVDSVSNTSTTAAATAASVKTAYDAAISANTNAGNLAANAYSNAIAVAANASNLTSGTVNIARIPTVDGVTNTSISHVAVANSVKTAYDTAIAANTNAGNLAANAYSNAIAVAANATNLTSGTVNIARIPTLDAVNNTSVSFVATANAVKTAYDTAISANTNAGTQAGIAYSNATAYADNRAANAYSNAIAIAANATNLTSGTVNIARIPTLDSVTNTSVSFVAVANSVKTAYDTAISANTNAGTQAGIAYSNAVTYADNRAANAYSNAIAVAANATNLTSGTVNIARIPTIDSVTSNSVSFVAVANSVKTAYDTAISANTNATNLAGNAYSNAINIASNATNLTSGTVNIARIPTLDAVNNTSVSFVAVANSVKTAYDAAITANTNAASAYTNAITVAANATNLTSGTVNIARIPTLDAVNNTSVSFVAVANSVKTAYDAAITANTNATNLAGNAYSNAIAVAANATNLTSGTVAEARLPFRMNQNVRTTDNVTFANASFTGSVGISGDLTVTGNITSVNVSSISVADSLIKLAVNNNTDTLWGGFVIHYNGSGNTTNHAGLARDPTSKEFALISTFGNETNIDNNIINISDPSFTYANLQVSLLKAGNSTVFSTINSTAFSGTANNATNAFGKTEGAINANSALTANLATTALTANNATNFNGQAAAFYTNATNISTGTLAAARLPSLFLGTTTIQSTSAAQAVSGITTLAAGNTTITGFANVTSTIQGGAGLTIAGAASGITTLAAGNTTVSGWVSASSARGTVAAPTAGQNNSALYVTGSDTAYGILFGVDPATGKGWIQSQRTDAVATTYNLRLNPAGGGVEFAGAASGITTLAAGNTTITGFVNATSTIQGGAGLTIAGAASGITTLAAGNTTITGFINATSTIQGGAGLTIAGAASGITTLAAGNTTITGFVNATSTIQGGAGLTIAGAASGITTLAAGNTTITGFVNATASVNSAVLSVGTNFVANATQATLGNGKRLVFLSNSAATGTYLELQSDNNLVLYTTNTLGVARAVFNVYANSNSGTQGGAIRFNTDVDMSSLGIYANNSLGTAGQVLASNGTSVYWAPAPTNGTVTSVATANGLSGGPITSTGTIGVVTGSTLTVNTTGIHVNSALSIDRVLTSNNGGGTNFAVGDDAWIGDVNIADTLRIAGQQSANNGYIVFGNADNSIKLGRAGTGPLTWNGAFSVTGGLTTLSANLVMANNAITNPILAGYTEHEVSNTATTGSWTMNCTTANFFDLTLTGNITIVPSNVPPSTRMWAGTLAVKQDATGGRTITWPTGIRWPGGVVPPATTTANAVDIWSLMTYDGGTTWIGSLTVKDAK